MTRVIHTGDTHMGYTQYHSPVRRQDFLDAFAAVIDDAIEGEVDAVVHAGDLFHDRRPELTDLMGTISILRRLDDAGVPFLAVVGNHESTRGGQWLDLFERLGLATRLGDDPTVVGDTSSFYGLDHVPVSRRDDLDYAFDDHDADYAPSSSRTASSSRSVTRTGTRKRCSRRATWTSTRCFSATTTHPMSPRSTARGSRIRGRPSAPARASARGAATTSSPSTPPTPPGATTAWRSGGARSTPARSSSWKSTFARARARRGCAKVRQHDLGDAVVLVDVTGEGDPVTPAAIEEFATDEGALIDRSRDRPPRGGDGCRDRCEFR